MGKKGNQRPRSCSKYRIINSAWLSEVLSSLQTSIISFSQLLGTISPHPVHFFPSSLPCVRTWARCYSRVRESGQKGLPHGSLGRKKERLALKNDEGRKRGSFHAIQWELLPSSLSASSCLGKAANCALGTKRKDPGSRGEGPIRTSHPSWSLGSPDCPKERCGKVHQFREATGRKKWPLR